MNHSQYLPNVMARRTMEYGRRNDWDASLMALIFNRILSLITTPPVVGVLLNHCCCYCWANPYTFQLVCVDLTGERGLFPSHHSPSGTAPSQSCSLPPPAPPQLAIYYLLICSACAVAVWWVSHIIEFRNNNNGKPRTTMSYLIDPCLCIAII